MEMISTSRYKNYYDDWANSINFYDKLAQLAYLLITSEKPIENTLSEENDSPNMAVIVIGSSRGLCGSYNSNIFKLLEIHIKRAKRFKKNLLIYASGKKVINYLKYRSVKIAGVFDEFDEVPDYRQARKIADDFAEKYKQRQISYLGIIYTRFFSVASQRAQTLTILPVSELIDDLTTRATVIWPWQKNFEDFELSPNAEDIFEAAGEMMIRASILSCFRDAALSEHLARVVAMRSATENANKMIEELSLEYNRARQSQITGELLDITGGVEAMNA
jgi:F-type H+-transporting ATPase subunit gamma